MTRPPPPARAGPAPAEGDGAPPAGDAPPAARGLPASDAAGHARDDPDEERRLAAAVLGTPGLLIVVLDRDRRIVRCNRCFEKFAGRPAAAVAGQPFVAVLASGDGAQDDAWLDALAAGRSPAARETTAARADGSLQHVSWLGNRIPGAQDGGGYLVLAGLDVTEQRRTEDELRQRRAEVARLHRVYTAGELAAALAHELNQPLAAMSAYADAALQRLRQGRGTTAEYADDFEQIAAQARRAARTIADLRRFLARGDGAKPSPCDINEIVRAARALILADGRRNEAEIVLDLGDDLAPVRTEPMQLEHVIVNLLLNALDALRERAMVRGRITITTRARSQAEAMVTVRDNGPGVPAGEVERIFEPFHTTKSGGLGIGLPISRSIVESHGGRLWAEAGGDGGVFRLTLPFVHGAADLPG